MSADTGQSGRRIIHKNTTTVLSAMPLLGYVKLDMFANTLTQIYRNPHNAP
jgi:hypothetical protein